MRLPPDRPLFLCGPSGAGKTSVGRRVAAMLGVPFVDLDARIVEQEGRPVPDLFREGERAFREAEWRALARLLTDLPAPGTVIALGGGTLVQEGLLAAVLDAGTLVHLDAAPATLARRLADDATVRPLLAGADDPVARLAALRRERAGGYGRAAVRVDTDALSVEETAVVLLRRLWEPSAGPWREPPVPLAPGLPAGRGVVAGPGALPRAILAAEDEVPGALALLVDEDLPHVHAGALGPALGSFPGGAERVRLLTVRAGEAAKGLGVAAATWEALLEAGLDRDGWLVAVGGGTVSDLAGVVAALYKRGISLALVPTTLLAQHDAALGGKNALNLGETKNVLGTVRFPREVAIDPLWLATLSPRELAQGLAEAVRSALVGDPGLLDVLEELPAGVPSLPGLAEVAGRAARVKLAIVSRDPEERGERALLNLGHTLGHALEGAAGEGGPSLGHGKAVAIGMVFAARLAAAAGVLADRELPARLVAVLSSLGLPVAPPPGIDRAALLRHLGRDKKRRGGSARFVLPVRAGEAVVREVDEGTVLRELRAFFDGEGGEDR